MNFALSKAIRFLLAATLTLGMVMSVVVVSMSHLPSNVDAVEQIGHAELADTIDGHGHNHEDGNLDEQDVRHTHGHNPADHSHDTPNLLAYRYLKNRDMMRIRFMDIPASNELGAFSRLDRPPKSVSLI